MENKYYIILPHIHENKKKIGVHHRTPKSQPISKGFFPILGE